MGLEPNRRSVNSFHWLSQKWIFGAFAILGIIWWMFLSSSAPSSKSIEHFTDDTSEPPIDSNTPSSPPGLDLDDILFAILTDNGYHKNRAKAIHNTWLSNVPHYQFFSSQELDDIPTTQLAGSSFRVFPVLRYLLSSPESKLLKNPSGSPDEKWRWLVIVDDGVFVNLQNLVDTIEESGVSELENFPVIYANNSEGFPTARRIHTFILNPELLDELSECSSLMFEGSIYSSAPCREDHNNDNRLVNCVEYYIRIGTTSAGARHLDLAVSDIVDWNDAAIANAVSLKNLSPEQMMQAAGKSSHAVGYYDTEFASGNILYGVLTTGIYHQIRVESVIKPSWGSKVPLIAYYSETDDSSIPTTVVNSYIADAPEKECKILYQAYGDHIENNEEVKWFVRVDDDTIVCPSKMEALLSRYDPSEPFFIGSCYVHYGEQNLFDYAPLGAGIALSRTALEMLVEFIDTTMGGCENAPLTEDPNVWVAKVMRDLGVGCTNEYGFNMPQLRTPDNDVVTVHYVRDITDAIVLQTHHGCV